MAAQEYHDDAKRMGSNRILANPHPALGLEKSLNRSFGVGIVQLLTYHHHFLGKEELKIKALGVGIDSLFKDTHHFMADARTVVP